jgi:hypothetical protein
MEPVSNSDGASHERDPLKEEHSELLAPSQGDVKEISEDNLQKNYHGEENTQNHTCQFTGVIKTPP